MLQNKDDYDFTYKMLQEIDFSSAFIHSYIVLGFAFERRLPVTSNTCSGNCSG
jgi:hypothetical protein